MISALRQKTLQRSAATVRYGFNKESILEGETSDDELRDENYDQTTSPATNVLAHVSKVPFSHHLPSSEIPISIARTLTDEAMEYLLQIKEQVKKSLEQVKKAQDRALAEAKARIAAEERAKMEAEARMQTEQLVTRLQAALGNLF